MKFKLQRPRSCLGWFGWVAGILIAFVLFSNVYAQVRLYIARTQAEALARELGYEPKDLLRFRTNINNVNIVTGSSACDAEIFFITSLGFDEFQERLVQAMPGTHPVEPTPIKATDWWDLWWSLPVEAYDANGDKVENEDLLPPVPRVTWFLSEDSLSPTTGMAQLHQTEQTPLSLQYDDQPIADNIALVRWRAGRYPIWVMCF